MAAGKNAANLDWLTEMYEHDAYDEFWKARSFIARAKQITIPTLHGGVWFDHFIRGTLSSHEAIEVPKRLFVGPGSLATRTDLGDGGLSVLHVEWFDHFLRDAPNGVAEQPPVRLYLMGKEDYIDEPHWPVKSVDTDFFLGSGPTGSVDSRNDGALGVAPGNGGVDLIVHDPHAPLPSPRDGRDQGPFEQGCLTYTSAPLDHRARGDRHPPAAPLRGERRHRRRLVRPPVRRRCPTAYPSSSTPVPSRVPTSTSHEAPTPLVAGRTYLFAIEIWPIANLFAPGHRIRVDVATSDYPFFESNPVPSRNEVFFDPARPSRLVLPVVERTD